MQQCFVCMELLLLLLLSRASDAAVRRATALSVRSRHLALPHLPTAPLQRNATQHVSHLAMRHPSLPSRWITNPWPPAPAWWRRATNHQCLDRRAGTQVCGGGGGWGRGGPACQGAFPQRLKARAEGGSYPAATPPLWGFPIHTTRWRLALTFNERYPSPGAPPPLPTPPQRTPEHVSLQFVTLHRTKAQPRESENTRRGGNTPCFIYYFTCNYDEEVFTLLPLLYIHAAAQTCNFRLRAEQQFVHTYEQKKA